MCMYTWGHNATWTSDKLSQMTHPKKQKGKTIDHSFRDQAHQLWNGCLFSLGRIWLHVFQGISFKAKLFSGRFQWKPIWTLLPGCTGASSLFRHSQEKTGVLGIVPCTSLPSFVPKHLDTRQISHSFIQAEEKNRCLTPKITQTLWTGCAVFQAGQANAARPAISLLLTWLRHCTTLCAFLHNPDKTTEFSSTSLHLLWIQSRLSSQLLFLSWDPHCNARHLSEVPH